MVRVTIMAIRVTPLFLHVREANKGFLLFGKTRKVRVQCMSIRVLHEYIRVWAEACTFSSSFSLIHYSGPILHLILDLLYLHTCIQHATHNKSIRKAKRNSNQENTIKTLTNSNYPELCSNFYSLPGFLTYN